MRIKTVTDDPKEVPATSSKGGRELQVGIWEEDVNAETWQRHLIYPLTFYEQFIVHITRSWEAMYGEKKGPFSLDMKVRRLRELVARTVGLDRHAPRLAVAPDT